MRNFLLGSLTLCALLLIGGALILTPAIGAVLAQGDATPQPTEEATADAVEEATPEVTAEATVEATAEATEAVAPQPPQLLWVRIDTGFSPIQVADVTVGGVVDMHDILGDPCAQNTFAAPLPVIEFHLLSDSPRLRIGFTTDDGSQVALALWDSVGQTWWCTISGSATAELQFEPLVAGDYPVYVGVIGGTQKVTGTLIITEAVVATSATPEETVEATSEATQEPPDDATPEPTPARRRGNRR